MAARLALLPALLMLASHLPAHAGWEQDGGSICYAAHSQIHPEMVPDGTGGAVVAWEDSRDGPGLDVYAQRVTATGAPVWTLQGVPVCAAAGDQEDIAMVADGAGGAFIAWADYRNGADWDIYAQHLDATGSPTWDLDGVAVATAVYQQEHVAMIADGAGGVILAWQDGRNFGLDYSLDIYAQRLDAAGVAQWTAGGREVVSLEGSQQEPVLLTDGSGGAFVAWEDTRHDTFDNDLVHDVYAARVTAAGGVAWEALILSAIYSQTDIRLVPAADGALVFWYDSRNLNPDIYGSRVSAAGGVAFPTDTGTSIVSSDDSEYLAAAVSDGAGGAILFWNHNTDTAHDLRVHRVDGDLADVWTPGGLVLCDAAELQTGLRAVSDGWGGALAVWQDERSGSQEDIYAQRLDPDGFALWGANGQAVCLDAARQLFPVICGDGLGGALMAWSDQRLGTPGDIWGHHVDSTGDLVPVRVPWRQAIWLGNAVEVSWRLVGNDGPVSWLVERASCPGGEQVDLSLTVMRDGADTWTLRDGGVAPGATYTYRVSLDGPAGAEELFVTEPVVVPAMATALLPPHPNPCNPRTRLTFTLARGQTLNLAVFDLAGRRVARLADGPFPAGRHVIDWDGRGDDRRMLPAGTYLVRLAGERLLAVTKLQLVR